MSHSQSAGQQLSVDDLSVVMEVLNDAHAKWYDIGLQLRLRVGTLDAIKEQYDDPSHCLRETLKTWLKTCPLHVPPTWKNIVNALRSCIIGEVRLAADLEQKYCSTQDTNVVVVTHHHALPAAPSLAYTQTTPPQQSQSQGHVPLSSLSLSQAHTLTTNSGNSVNRPTISTNTADYHPASNYSPSIPISLLPHHHSSRHIIHSTTSYCDHTSSPPPTSNNTHFGDESIITPEISIFWGLPTWSSPISFNKM